MLPYLWATNIDSYPFESVTNGAQTKSHLQRASHSFGRHLNLNRTLPRTPVDSHGSFPKSKYMMVQEGRVSSEASDIQTRLSDWERALGLWVGSDRDDEDAKWLHIPESNGEDGAVEVEMLSGSEVLLKKSRSKAKAKNGPKTVQEAVSSADLGDPETGLASASVLSSTSDSTSALILQGGLERPIFPSDDDVQSDPFISTIAEKSTASSASTIRLPEEVKASEGSSSQTEAPVKESKGEVEDEVITEALDDAVPPDVPPKDRDPPSTKQEGQRDLSLPPVPPYQLGVGSGFVAFQKIQTSLASGFHHVMSGVAGVQGAVAGLGGGGGKTSHPSHVGKRKGPTADARKKSEREQKAESLFAELTTIEEKPHARYTFVLPDPHHHHQDPRPSLVQTPTTPSAASSTQSSGFTFSSTFGSTIGSSAAPVSEPGSTIQAGKKARERITDTGDAGGLKVSCTVYYGRQFASLRALCYSSPPPSSPHDHSSPESELTFIQSISSTLSWSDVEGGKSRSGFWKTRDGRYVIKELVRPRWPGGVDDLCVSMLSIFNSNANYGLP